jgi:hypothetical protein
MRLIHDDRRTYLAVIIPITVNITNYSLKYELLVTSHALSDKE